MSTTGNESMRIQQVAQFRRLWPIGLVAAAGATVANVVFFFVSKAIGIPYLVAMQGSLGPGSWGIHGLVKRPGRSLRHGLRTGVSPV